MTTDRPATTRGAAGGSTGGRNTTHPPRPPAFDAGEFDALREMIGQDGVIEMINIFETETRQRLRRLTVGNRDPTTLAREMHTLKGAAGTVAAPRLAALGRGFEQAARSGFVPTPDDVRLMEEALEAFLIEAKARTASQTEMA